MSSAQPWRYVDKKGSVHYTDNPHELPPKQRAAALEQLEEKRKARAQQAAQEALAAQEAAAKGPAIQMPADTPRPVQIAAEPAEQAQEAQADPQKDWQDRVKKAEEAAKDAQQAAKRAEQTAVEASQRALVTPLGPHFAAYEDAKSQAQAQQEKAKAAQEALEKLRKSGP